MSAKEYLDQIGINLDIIKNKKNQIEELFALATSVNAPMGTEPVQTSNISDKVGKFGSEFADLHGEIKAEIIRLQKDNMQRIQTIQEVGNRLQYNILYCHYVDGLEFNDIADELHFAPITISRNHAKALEKIDEILKCITNDNKR